MRLRAEAGAILVLGGLAAVAVGFMIVANREAQAPAHVEDAEIVRFGVSSHEEGNRPLVIVRPRDGQPRQLRAYPSQLAGCRQGDRIRLLRQGRRLRVHPLGCRAAPAGA